MAILPQISIDLLNALNQIDKRLQGIEERVDFLYEKLPTPPEKEWLTESESQKLLEVSSTTLWRYRIKGLVEYRKIGNKTYYRTDSIMLLK